MNNDQLISQFNSAINWNAALYLIHKVLYVSTSLLLFNRLSTIDYSAWANINSTIFLSLLWLDCGLSKTLPRFSPEFLNSIDSIRRFITMVALFQICILLISSPLLLKLLQATATALHQDNSICLYGIALFFTQGIIAVIRLLFHSLFFHKQFNLIAITATVVEMFITILSLTSISTSTKLLSTILFNKIIVDSVLLTVGIVLLHKLFSNYLPSQARTAEKSTLHQLIKHSTMMWMSNNAKSLSDRNFLIPFITNALGAETANIFKVANDIALLFYRFILKTIGTADTSLLAFTQLYNKNDMEFALKKLTTKVAALCLPLFGAIGIMFFCRSLFFKNQFVFHLFIIMVTFYLIEALLLPFERFLEVKREYKYLAIGYIPYSIGLCILLNKTTITLIGLIPFIVGIQCVRLLSISLIAFLSCGLHSIALPFRLRLIHPVVSYTYVYVPIVIVGFIFIATSYSYSTSFLLSSLFSLISYFF